MKVSEVEDLNERMNWNPIFEKVKSSSTGKMMLSFDSTDKALKAYNSLTNPYYAKVKHISAKLRGKLVYLIDNSRKHSFLPEGVKLSKTQRKFE